MLQKFFAKLSAKEKKILYIAFPIVLLALFDRLLLGPSLNKIKFLDEEIIREEAAVKRDLRILSYKDNILKEQQIMDKFLLEEIPDDDVINNQFFSIVEKLATQANVNLIKGSPDEPRKNKDYIEYVANLDCSGDLKDVINFMHLINSTDDLLKVVRFNMTPKRGTPDGVTASLTVIKMVMDKNMTSFVVAEK
ncbi:MAG: hypothetical protein KC733_09395 [Candidatus Omnitrophica bacterium]|nr:hypothetical protein [Candidatus Omnitrophota bacterium]